MNEITKLLEELAKEQDVTANIYKESSDKLNKLLTNILKKMD